jgi:hypothetical protein
MGTLKPKLGTAIIPLPTAQPSSEGSLFQNHRGRHQGFPGGGMVMWPGMAPAFSRLFAGRKRPGTLRLRRNPGFTGDLKQMEARWLAGTSFRGYGATLTVGVGLPIPILNEEILAYAAKSDEELYAPIADYSDSYPNNKRQPGSGKLRPVKNRLITCRARRSRWLP